MLSMWPSTNVFHIQVLVIYYFFPTPPIKLILRQQIGGGLLIANHLDQSLWCANRRKQWAAVRSYLLHSFVEVHSVVFAAPFTGHRNTVDSCWGKTIFLTQTGIFWLLIANHLDQSVWWVNRKHWAAVRSNLLHSFFSTNTSLPATAKLCTYVEL